MAYPDAAWERAMTVQEVMLKAVSGELHWFRAADILGWSPRTLRRWRERYEAHGYAGLVDKRLLRPSIRRAPAGEVERVLRLYRERYGGFNVRHFHQIATREHAVTLSYSYVKQALQRAGLVKKHRARGRHRRRREPRACFGEMLHLDGSVHAWLALEPDARPCLILVSDDATKRVLAAVFFPSESSRAVMTSLAGVLRTDGLPMALYTDRAHWAFHTPVAKGPIDKTRLTQLGRALARLGIEHIPSYSPQARGRSERLNRTFQDRLVNELRVAGITTIEAANRYLTETFVPHHNATFARPPRDPASAFVPLGPVDLDAILCHEEERVVARDNTVCLERQVLQIAPQPGRRTCSGLRVTVRRHLDGHFTVTRGAQGLGQFDPTGQPMDAAAPADVRTERRTPTRRLDRRPRTPAAHKRPPASL
ncbi:MAG: ISNCY family transposase [Pseudomonadota bacterium]